MVEILSIPVEFDTIQFQHPYFSSGSIVPYYEKREAPRPPLGPFMHHAVQTFAKACSEGRIGLNWRDSLACAQKTWKSLSLEELLTLRQAADKDKQRYNEHVALAGEGGAEELRREAECKQQDYEDGAGYYEVAGGRGGAEELVQTKVDPVGCWRPTADENLTADEKKLLESIPPDVHRWDRSPREARNAYTLYYGDRLTAEGSPHLGEDPHCPSTRAKIHAAWEAEDHETRPHFKNLANIDRQEYDRQENERSNGWLKAWFRDSEHQLLLRKVIDRWHPQSSFEDGQNRPPSIPRRGRQAAVPTVDYGLTCLNYPVIRTDYSNGAVYEHLRHVLFKSSFEGGDGMIDLTWYDGLQPPSESTAVEKWEEMPDDPRASDYEWCKTNFENNSLDDLKASFGELSFHRKEHIPIYSFGGKRYAIIVDSRSMRAGTVMFVSLDSIELLDTRPDGDRGADGAWEQDPQKQWYMAPRMQAVNVVSWLVHLDNGNCNWDEFVQHEVDQGLDLVSDPKAQRWRGWQWAIEDVFGDQRLENVVGVVSTIPDDAYVFWRYR